jgi:hypothetical protein
MIIPVMAALLVLVPVALGGRLSRLSTIRFQAAGWLAGTLIVQVIVLEAVPDPGPVLRVLLESVHVGTYLMAAGFLWANRQVPWLWMIGLGAVTNGATIAINGGTLPARPEALRTAGLPVAVDGFANSAALSHPRLWFLGDVFALPAGFPLANVFSVGDLLILLGVGLASLWICGTWWRTAWQPPARFQRPYPRTRRYSQRLTAASRLPWLHSPA